MNSASFTPLTATTMDTAHRDLRSGKTMFQISDTIRTTKTPEGAVVLDIHQNRILTTNAVGARILELIQQGREEAQIIDEISLNYGLPLETASADVREFLESLLNCGVVFPCAEVKRLTK